MSLYIPNGKPGGITLPDIPADILADYPYAVIIDDRDKATGQSTGMYILIATKATISYIPASVMPSSMGINYDQLYSTSKGVRQYGYMPSQGVTDWMLVQEDTEKFPWMGVGVGDYDANEQFYIIWSNHDIKTATGYNQSTAVITMGQEIYVSEQQTIGGIELPKIPAGLETSYPYRALVELKQLFSEDIKQQIGAEDVELHVILMSPSPMVYAAESSTGYHYIGCVGHPCFAASNNGGHWYQADETWILTDMDVTSADMGYLVATFTVVYSNHNIMDATVNADGSITTLNTVYYQGSGAVVPPDTFAIDHASLVYMAREARRLSGQTLVPLSMEDTMTIINDIETYEDAEGMVF